MIESLDFALREIEALGTLDGGDVLKVGDTVFGGHGGRTNAEGIAQLGSILNLKSAVTALPNGTVIGRTAL